jgi:3-oxoacid CoA-transferase subunit A
MGIPGFFTPAGVGTLVADGGLPWRYDDEGNVVVASPRKEQRDFDIDGRGSRPYVLEEAIVTDFALVRAWKGDRAGNLVYRETAQNFNPLCAMAGRVTIAEVEHLVAVGEIDPGQVHTPGVFVSRLVQVSPGETKRIEKRTTRPRPPDGSDQGSEQSGGGR